MPVICASIPFDDRWPADEDMRNRNAVMKALTDYGIGHCLESGGLRLDGVLLRGRRRGSRACRFPVPLGGAFPGRGFRSYVEEVGDAG